VTVVTDTSVVLNLCVIGQQEVLPVLFGDILAPTIVVQEFQQLASSASRFQGLAFPAFIRQTSPKSLLPSLTASGRLQAGEIAALSLAVALGLRPVGLLGILLEAKQRSLIPALAPLLDRLENEAQFWISPTLRAAVLSDAGESS
jgi:uncharacterized protein